MAAEFCFFEPTCERWRQWLIAQGENAFRGDQIFVWIHRFGITDPERMTNLPIQLRQFLSREINWTPPLLIDNVQASADGSYKFAFLTVDGHVIESVLIPGSGRDRRKYTVCLSSQVGCKLGCAFCATATLGFQRNLTAAEIVAQVHHVLDFMAHNAMAFDIGTRPRTQWLTNLVYMGMGEPLQNLQAVLDSIAILSDPQGLNFSHRRITLSTAGWVPGLQELATNPSFTGNLAVSLHACNNRVRTQLMPINRAFGLEDLRAALLKFPLPARKRITLEYILFDGINDTPADAKALIRFTQGMRVKINLIPYHAWGNSPSWLQPTSHDRKEAFVNILRAAHLTVIERVSAGSDIDAACGQLAARKHSRDNRV